MKFEKVILSKQIYQQLRKDILNQTLAAGEKLTIKMLHERFSTIYFDQQIPAPAFNHGFCSH